MYNNVLMIAVNDIESQESLGVTKKLMGEFHAFEKLCDNAYLLIRSNNEVALIHKGKKRIVVSKQIKGYFTELKLFDIAPRICQQYGIDLCYIRYPMADWAFLKMLQRLSRITKIYIEIPTFPYDNEHTTIKNYIARFNYRQDKVNRFKLNKYVDHIVTFSEDDEIYGIPCIHINNGIDIETVKYIGDDLTYDMDMTLISVAVMRPIHGYDRVIEGMAQYYKKYKRPKRIVRYLVVGNGPDTDRLKDIVSRNHLEPYVEFCGKQSGESLDKLFQKSNLGLAVLAGHREGHVSVSDLKSREYCARGMPFITANKDNAIPENMIFMKKVSMDDEPLDIDDIFCFFDYIKENKEIHQICRQYAEDYFCWEYQLESVLHKQ